MGDERLGTIEDLTVAIAHWHVNSWGGAEYLVTKLAEVVGAQTVFTLGDPTPDTTNPYGDVSFTDLLSGLDWTPLRRLQGRVGRVFEYALWEDVDWRDYGDPDVLITSGATTRAVITPDDTLHVNYCHSPPRWFYDLYHDRKGTLSGKVARPLVRYLRTRDMTIDPRVDHYFANSPIIQRRLWKYYKRDAEVLYPPLDLSKYRNDGDEEFYLHLGRLDVEKGVPEIVAAFERLEETLVLAGGKGDVSDEMVERIERAPNIDYRGFVSEEVKYNLLATCRGVVFNGRNEDFGIVPIEANASGKPCLVPNEGFPEMFIEDGVNGLIHDGSATGIMKAIGKYSSSSFEKDLRTRVLDMSVPEFKSKLTRDVSEKIISHIGIRR
ncbi:glycosyltransferase [Haladaptatus sp. DJG-WS-42]|uniref:glycosyltransferase n=1 Tax=Haladaptatus sp. DJG-WS-42 TaxID=3120516 RepID=UPI0030CC0D27